MLRRSLATVVTALAAAATVLAFPAAGHSDAAGTCTLTPPARIAIYSDDTSLPAIITGDCRPDGYGYWYTNREEDNAFAGFSANGDEPFIEVPDVLDRYGLQQWNGLDAVRISNCTIGGEPQDECEFLAQNGPYSDIRLGTYAALTGTRNSASKITFTATTAIWSTGSNKLINRSMKGELQTQYADGTWHRVGNPITTGANGKATFAVGLGVRTWRFGVYSTPYSFNRLSTALTR